MILFWHITSALCKTKNNINKERYSFSQTKYRVVFIELNGKRHYSPEREAINIIDLPLPYPATLPPIPEKNLHFPVLISNWDQFFTVCSNECLLHHKHLSVYELHTTDDNWTTVNILPDLTEFWACPQFMSLEPIFFTTSEPLTQWEPVNPTPK